MLIDLERVPKNLLVQANNLADRYSDELGMSRQEYIDSFAMSDTPPQSMVELPKIPIGFYPSPAGLEVPLLVQIPTLELSPKRMCEVLGISPSKQNYNKDWDYYLIEATKDIDPAWFTTPNVNYQTWITQIQTWSRGLGPMDVMNWLNAGKRLPNFYRGGTIYDALALSVQCPEMLEHLTWRDSKDYDLSLPGSSVRSYKNYIARLFNPAYSRSWGEKGAEVREEDTSNDFFQWHQTYLIAGREVVVKLDGK